LEKKKDFVESMYKGIAQDRIMFCGGGVVKCAHLIQFEHDFCRPAIT